MESKHKIHIFQICKKYLIRSIFIRFAGITDVYGSIEFQVNGVSNASQCQKYIRLSCETKAETVVKFMTQYWKLKHPDLIISITGGAKNFTKSRVLQQLFPMNIVYAANRASNKLYFFPLSSIHA